MLKERADMIAKRRHTTYVDSMVIKGLHSLVNETDKALAIDMLCKGIAPRPEQEIMHELTIFENLKKKNIEPVVKKETAEKVEED